MCAHSPFAIPTTIECCRDRDLCNRELTPMYVQRPEDDDLTSEYVGYVNVRDVTERVQCVCGGRATGT